MAHMHLKKKKAEIKNVITVYDVHIAQWSSNR